MFLSLVMLVLGLALLIFGGDLLIRGSVSLATRMRISATIVGLTVVAFGTSTPELVVNLTAAFRGTPDLAFGNIIGSNIANIGLLLGLTAVLMPIAVHRTIILREAPMMALIAVAALALAEDAIFRHTASGSAFDRGDGIILLLLFGIFMYYTIGDALRQRADDPYVREVEQAAAAHKPMNLGLAFVLIVVGLAMLFGGGQLTVIGGADLARRVGVPEVVIGLTLVAVGTSLPELAAGIAAVRRRQHDMAVGNIVGSNIYNLAFVLGVTSTIAPVSLPARGEIDMLVMLAFSIALIPMVITKSRLSRGEGALLLGGYVVYIAWLFVRG
jgi:cation:H+ antiporter